MSPEFATRTIIEFLVIALLLFGFMHEEKVIAFEDNVKRIIVGNIRHYIRNKKRKETIARGEHLRLHCVNSRKTDSSVGVA